MTERERSEAWFDTKDWSEADVPRIVFQLTARQAWQARAALHAEGFEETIKPILHANGLYTKEDMQAAYTAGQNKAKE